MTGLFDNYFHKNMFCGNSKPHNIHVWRDLHSIVMIQYNCPGIPEPKVTLSEDHARLVKENKELSEALGLLRVEYTALELQLEKAKFEPLLEKLEPVFRETGLTYNERMDVLKAFDRFGFDIKKRDGY